MKLLMITGLGSAKDLASGKKGAFYNTLEEFHKYWERIDIIAPKAVRDVRNDGNVGDEQFQQAQRSNKRNDPTPQTLKLFGNVYIHISPWPLVFHPFWFLKKGLELFKKERFDLMTVQEYPPFYNGIGARMLWKKTKVPYVLEIHHIPGYPRSIGWKERIYRNLVKFFIKYDAAKAVAVRTVNQNQVPNFLKRWGVPSEKIKFIPSLYIDLETFQPQVVDKKYDVIFIGRLEKNKGVDLLLEAASKLKVKSEKLKVLIVGDGSLSASLKLKVKGLKLGNNVIFHGWARNASEVARLLNESKILVMPSYNEGGPRVVLEAIACGVPVLATPVGIVPDIIKDGESGGIIDWNATDIAKKISDLLHDRGKNQTYVLAGFEISKQFEKKEAIKNYAEKLQSLI